jgi:signal transduction histidine kinase
VLSRFLDEVLIPFQALARGKGLALSYSVDADIPREVRGDAGFLRQIITNLISNAIKFTNIGGQIDIYSSPEQTFVKITVADNGVGINEDVQNKLFKLETNLTSIGTANEKGSGLGLLLCKEFVVKHGGKIWIESKPGKGSKFNFTLPKSASMDNVTKPFLKEEMLANRLRPKLK